MYTPPDYPQRPYFPRRYSESEVLHRSTYFRSDMEHRRSVRQFSDKPVPLQVIENIMMTAATAPSGANKQPWTFCAISDPNIKKEVRIAAEKEETEFYTHRATEDWLKDLEPFGTNSEKPFLEVAPWLIVMFRQVHGLAKDGSKIGHYYVNESNGIAAGILISAIHHAGLVTLTHTPSPMNFLQKILNRPDHERPYLLLPVGYAAPDVMVPDISRKPVNDVISYY